MFTGLMLKGPPPVEKQSPQAALRQLLKVGAGYDSPGTLASWVREKVSLPAQKAPVPLVEVLLELEREMVENFAEKMLLSPEEMAGELEKSSGKLGHKDPVLANSQRKYHEFVADMYTAGLVKFTHRPKVIIGAFVVLKKNGKQRLVIDARPSNRLFRQPPTTLLGSMETWARVELGEDSEMFVAQEDVKDYFYRLAISRELGEYFAFPKICVERLSQELGYTPSELLKGDVNPDAPIHPFMCVLPMGFSWAFHLAHQVHCHLSRLALPGIPLLRDREPLPRIGRQTGDTENAMLVYADNNNHIL